MFCNSKSLWVWTGFLYEYLVQDTAERKALLERIDVLVDGPFINHLYQPKLPYKGSLNQRIIDVPPSLNTCKLYEYITN